MAWNNPDKKKPQDKQDVIVAFNTPFGGNDFKIMRYDASRNSYGYSHGYGYSELYPASEPFINNACRVQKWHDIPKGAE